MSAAELSVLWKPVGKAGGMREQIADASILAIVALEFGKVVRDGIIEREQAPLDQKHDRTGGDGLRDRGEQKDGVGHRRTRAVSWREPAETFVDHDALVAGHQ